MNSTSAFSVQCIHRRGNCVMSPFRVSRKNFASPQQSFRKSRAISVKARKVGERDRDEIGNDKKSIIPERTDTWKELHSGVDKMLSKYAVVEAGVGAAAATSIFVFFSGQSCVDAILYSLFASISALVLDELVNGE